MSFSTTVAGIDIGYGGLKIVGGSSSGDANRMTEVVLPAGAAPTECLPRRSDNRPDLKGGELVLIGGKEWSGGVDQLHIQNRARMTHDDYPRTQEYEALYLTALARLGMRKVEMLVTGLPVSQYYGPNGQALAQHMREKMLGRKLINADVIVEVNKMMIVPQPLGTFFGLACEPKYASLATNNDVKTVVVDPGFFSVDWVLMSGKSVMHSYSGTSKMATSMVLEQTAAALSRELGREVSRDQLDACLRRGHYELSVGFERSMNFRETLYKVAKVVVGGMIGDLQTSLRAAGSVDLLILTGGGSDLYADAVKDAMPGVSVVVPEDVVLANARGYAAIARMRAQTPATAS